MTSGRLVPIGTVVGVFGLAGEVKVAAGDPADVRAGLDVVAGERRLRIAGVRRHQAHVLTSFEGIGDVVGAKALMGARLLAAESDLAPPPAGAYRDGDLFGLHVVDAALGDLGRVTAVHHYPASDMLELEDGLLVPLLAAYGVRVDLESRTVWTALPDGYLELRKG